MIITPRTHLIILLKNSYCDIVPSKQIYMEGCNNIELIIFNQRTFFVYIDQLGMAPQKVQTSKGKICLLSWFMIRFKGST